MVSLLAAVAFGLAVLMAAWTRACAGNSCPSIAELGAYDPNQASKVYAADGRLITDLGLERRTVVPLAEMSPVVKAAFLATEDKRFYEHHGIDWYRVLGAIRSNLFEMRLAEGFSTITMQLARNIWPEDISGRDKSLRRKLREAKVALEIEEKYPKDKILELYLNQIDLGNRAFGVEAASQRYFGKSVRDLNVAEAATLAAIPKAPVPLQSPEESEPQHPAPEHGAESAARQRAARARRRPSGGRPIRCCSPPAPTSAAPPNTSSSTSGSSSTRASAPISTARATGSTPPSTSISSRPPSGRWRPGSRRIESGADGKFEHPTYQQYQNSKADESDDADRRSHALSPGPRGHASRRRPARSAPWSAGATSATASSTGPPRRSASPAPPSSRSSTPPRSRRATRSRT